MSRGICFFAYNNEQIDYVKLALFAALRAKHHLGLPVCLITDQGGWDWLNQSQDSKKIRSAFDDLVITDDEIKTNVRSHFDSPWTEFRAQFSNSNKHKVFEYSPYDKTILLDIDYIVKTDYLLHAFDSYTGVSMFDNAISLTNQLPHRNEQWLFDIGIKMWWSTVIYFDKSDVSKMFFDLWEHVAENYSFYQYLYNFPGTLFRTDYCVSIACHILNGMQDNDMINNFGGIPMQNLSQKDDIIEAKNVDSWVCLGNNQREPWKNLMVRHENYDLHVMNKRALGRLIDGLN
jgi:hypothetical protein